MTSKPIPEALPTLLEEANISITIPEDVQVDDTLKQVKSIDLQVANDMLRSCYAGFTQVRSITGLCRLIDTTLNVIEKRRKGQCLQYGAPNQVSKAQDFEPLD